MKISGWERGANGVLVDCTCTDLFRTEHREGLPKQFYCADIDGILIEYALDDHRNRDNLIRNAPVVCFMERKLTEHAATDPRNRTVTSAILCMCRNLSRTQALPVRFFFIIGAREHYPWTMIELDINTGAECRSRALLQNRAAYLKYWQDIGLLANRAILAASVRDR